MGGIDAESCFQPFARLVQPAVPDKLGAQTPMMVGHRGIQPERFAQVMQSAMVVSDPRVTQSELVV
ncbi:hypothetical protein D3C77_793380 [compost metagenome]